MPMTEEKKQEIRDAAENGELSCHRVFQLSTELDLKLKEIGDFCNREGIKIKNCRLGCF